jgi:hypothetical protein
MSTYGYSSFLKTQVDASFVEVKAENASLKGQLDASFVALKTENASLKGQLDASFVALKTENASLKGQLDSSFVALQAEVNSGGGADTTALDASMTYVLNWINDNTDNLTTQVDEAINEKITTTLVDEYVARLDASDSALNQNIAQAVTDKEGQINTLNSNIGILQNAISNINNYLNIFSPTYTLVDNSVNVTFSPYDMTAIISADPAEVPNNSGGGGGGGSSSLPAYITAQSVNYTSIETLSDGTNTFQYDFENNQVILEVNLVTTYYNLVQGVVNASTAGGDPVDGIKYENSDDTTQYIIFQQSNEEGLTVLEATLDFSNNGIVAYGGEFTVSGGGGGGGGGEETQQVPAYLESVMGVNGATLTTASFTSGTNTFDISYDDMSSEWQLWLSGVKYQLGFDTAGRSRFFQETDSTYYIVFDATEPGGLKVLDYSNVTNFAPDETYTIVQ